jgi:hypothetical protein
MSQNDKRPGRGSNQPPLPRPVQEHLGQKLRAQLYEEGDKPQYLGDPAVPRHFDPIIEKIEQKDRVRRKAKIEEAGQQAVEAALTELANQDTTGKKTG